MVTLHKYGVHLKYERTQTLNLLLEDLTAYNCITKTVVGGLTVGQLKWNLKTIV